MIDENIANIPNINLNLYMFDLNNLFFYTYTGPENTFNNNYKPNKHTTK